MAARDVGAATVVVVGRVPASGSDPSEDLSAVHRVRAVDDADGARELTRGGEVDLLIVVAAGPPGTTALDLLREVRGHPELAVLPSLVLLPPNVPGLAAEVLRAGADDCLRLPVDPEEFRARVELRLRAARRRGRLEAETGDGRELLRELEHRVKGDLQTITSLLNLELRSTETEECRSTLEGVRGRVNTMTLLYRMLRETEGPSEVDLPRYLDAVVAAAAETEGEPRDGHRRETRIEPLQLGLDRAGSCGLMVHELVKWSLRGGAPKGEGRLRVLLGADGDTAVLSVEASGVGDGPGTGSGGVDGLGLVRALVRQLEGTIEVDEERHRSTTRIAFPREQGGDLSGRGRAGAGPRS